MSIIRSPTGDEDILSTVWKYYEYGRNYNNSLEKSQYAVAETNRQFFHGNQWIHLPDNEAMRRLQRPVFNIIQRITSLFVASLTSGGTTVNFEPLSYQPEGEAAELATAEVRNLLEKFKIDYRIREALFDGAITGDYCAHFFWNAEAKPFGGAFGAYRGEIEMELIDGINVMFGNPNLSEVEKQPYILLVGRDTVARLKEEALRWRRVQAGFASSGGDGSGGSRWFGGSPGRDGSSLTGRRGLNGGTGLTDDFDLNIVPDSEDAGGGWNGIREIQGDDDASAKALYVILYRKVRKPVSVPCEDGSIRTEMRETVEVSKVTRTAVIFSGVDTGLSRYPVAWGNWQKRKNCYHGRALVTEVIPNQIYINQMMAMVFRQLQTTAFPMRIYNADYLPGISNEVGSAIGVRNLLPGQTLGSIISTVPATDMSNQIIRSIEMCMEYTKECLGATDAQMGNLNATNTSALMVLQNASQIPLENMRANLYEWVEDIAAILLDMMGTYYGTRPILTEATVREPVTGADGRQLTDPVTMEPATVPVTKRTMTQYDFRKFRELWFHISADVGATSYYSEIAMVQTLHNLRKDGVIDIIDYLERIPDSLISRKDELIDKLKEKLNGTEGGTGALTAGTVPGAAEIAALTGGVPGALAGIAPGDGGFPGSAGKNAIPLQGTTGSSPNGGKGAGTKKPVKGIPGQGYTMGGQPDAVKKISMLPGAIQAQYDRLPKKAQDALMKM